MKASRHASNRYPSRIDTWLVIVVVVADLLALAACVPVIVTGIPAAATIVIVSLLFILGLPAWIFLATHYTFEAEVLTIRSGPFRWQVPIAQVTAVSPTRNPLSSPALSLDRLRIEYAGGRNIMVSPRDKAGFLRELESRRLAGTPSSDPSPR